MINSSDPILFFPAGVCVDGVRVGRERDENRGPSGGQGPNLCLDRAI